MGRSSLLTPRPLPAPGPQRVVADSGHMGGGVHTRAHRQECGPSPSLLYNDPGTHDMPSHFTVPLLHVPPHADCKRHSPSLTPRSRFRHAERLGGWRSRFPCPQPPFCPFLTAAQLLSAPRHAHPHPQPVGAPQGGPGSAETLSLCWAASDTSEPAAASVKGVEWQ